ncbi:MAG: carbohydrate ABC transporter permease [Ruminiclostridium sp.]|nr:carbohydrate ABC transporter permease [Ruminiclostridium sp.]
MRLDKKETAVDYIIILGFAIFCFMILYPFWQIIVNSVSTEAEIFTDKIITLFPKEFYIGNWSKVFRSNLVWQSFYNTVVITLLGSIYSLVLSASYAYPLSRKDLPHRNIWTLILLFTMFFSGGLIPYYLLMRSLNLLDTLTVLIIGSINVWNTLILRNYFMALPDSLIDSAKIDGASDIGVLTRIIVPLAGPVIATVFLWNLVGYWNSWVSAMIYNSSPDKQVLQIQLRKIILDSQFNIMSANRISGEEARTALEKMQQTVEGLKAAVLIFTTFPILASYPFLQKYFVKGIFIGSLKG